MAHHPSSAAQHVDPAEVQRAQSMWHSFVRLGKWTIMASVAVLCVLAIAFVDWR